MKTTAKLFIKLYIAQAVLGFAVGFTLPILHAMGVF
jgi:hypothetical protein